MLYQHYSEHIRPVSIAKDRVKKPWSLGMDLVSDETGFGSSDFDVSAGLFQDPQ